MASLLELTVWLALKITGVYSKSSQNSSNKSSSALGDKAQYAFLLILSNNKLPVPSRNTSCFSALE
jgi:hypothetical protein